MAELQRRSRLHAPPHDDCGTPLAIDRRPAELTVVLPGRRGWLGPPTRWEQAFRSAPVECRCRRCGKAAQFAVRLRAETSVRPDLDGAEDKGVVVRIPWILRRIGVHPAR